MSEHTIPQKGLYCVRVEQDPKTGAYLTSEFHGPRKSIEGLRLSGLTDIVFNGKTKHVPFYLDRQTGADGITSDVMYAHLTTLRQAEALAR